MKRDKKEITGCLDILVTQNEDEFEGITTRWNEVLIHGDPQGLRSLASLLLQLADLDQEQVVDIPIGAREHIQLRPKLELSNSSTAEVIIGRLDAKGTGTFYDNYIPKDKDRTIE